MDYNRPWVSPESQEFYNKYALLYRNISPTGFESEVEQMLEKHASFMDYECISLYAGTNIMNPRAARFQAASVGSRPSLGYPGDKYETGLQYAEQLEIMAVEILRRIFKCDFVEFRVGSGSLANLYAYMACTNPGDRIMALSNAAAGHVTHHTPGAAGLYGLDVHDIPFDSERMAVDLEKLETEAYRIKPKLIILGGSLALFPYPVKEVRAIADNVGAWLMFDAAHLSGIIAGDEFQQPLAEGAHLMTCSTYKSFGGPAGGLVLTNSSKLAERLDKIAYPGLTANFDLSRTATLVVAASDILEFGKEYARTCIANAQKLAEELAAGNAPVHSAKGRGFTMSHHVAIQAAVYGGGTTASRHLERANILTSGIGLPLPELPNDFNAIRIGTQEITRWGFKPQDMPELAQLINRVLVKGETPESVKSDVIVMRQRFQQLHFIRA
ncbi:aminotransferase class I/II-fold pyridoxal phosphate-dependent enzyme [Candidatus Chlorohelix sp.]|uniref:serine hydroxymethyltransferase n=1 Tax=Candidatus Chlorohelix sp. TaxID=3139201 RepID=UPI003041522F